MWKKMNLTDERLRGGTYSTLIFVGERLYLKVTNKLVKRTPDGTYLLYKDGFTFNLFHVDYGRYEKRQDNFVREVDSSELKTMFEEWIEDDELPLPPVTGKPLEELLDE